jgi:pyruvate-formate lyase-activating enzyme
VTLKKSGPARWVFEAGRTIAEHRFRVRRAGELPAPARREAGDSSAPLICHAVFEEVCVLANGDVVCSCADAAGLRVYGNIRRQPLAEILGGEMFREIREWQLESKPDRWCPATRCDCPLRVHRATSLDSVEGRRPKMLQLEPTSHCNLKCPECPVTDFATNPKYTADRTDTLTLAEMISIFEQLPGLEKVLFYNYGEAFLHAEAVPMLRWLRSHRPEISIHISTNALALSPARVREVVAEGLVDRMLFAIDGARQESYARYRVGGKLERALSAMRLMVDEANAAGTRERFEIWWQYILFEWNDSDAELEEAKQIAAQIGVPIEWVVTHTGGASQRYRSGSAELAALVGGERAFRALSCDLKGAEIVRSGGFEALRHRAALRPAFGKVSGTPGERILLPVVVQHQGLARWGGQAMAGADGAEGLDHASASYRLGLRLLDRDGRTIGELRGVRIPPGVMPGAELTFFVEVDLPEELGEFHLFLDLVEDGVCWFSERGSTPAICDLAVVREGRGNLRPPELVEPALSALGSSARDTDLDEARSKLASGGALEDLLVLLRSRGELPLAVELDLRARLGSELPASV